MFRAAPSMPSARGVVSLLQELIKIVQKRPLSRDHSRNDSTWFSFFFLFVFTLWLGLPRALALGMICYYLGITRTLVVYWIPEPGRPFNWVRVTPRSSRSFRGNFRSGRPVIKRFSCCPFDAFGGRGVVSLLPWSLVCANAYRIFSLSTN